MILTRQEWLRERPTFVGASEIASILGLPGAYSSIGAVWLDKVRVQEATEQEAAEADPETAEKLDRKSIGLLLEPAILEMYRMKNPGLTVYCNGLEIRRHPQYPFIGATRDALAMSEFGDFHTVEAKNVSVFKRAEWGDEGSDQVPAIFAAQGVQQMLVSADERFDTFVDFAVFFGGNDFRIFSVPYDAALANQITDVLCWFWNLVETRTPPPIDYGSSGAAKLMRQIYSRIVGEPKVIKGPQAIRAAALVAARDFASAQEKYWGDDGVKGRCSAELLGIVGEAPKAEIHLPDVEKPLSVIRSPRNARTQPAFDVPAHHVLQFDPYQQKARNQYFNQLEEETSLAIVKEAATLTEENPALSAPKPAKGSLPGAE